MRVDVQLNRCLCIHSLSQAVDITLQVLLYQRQITPEPVHSVLGAVDERTEKFRGIYNEVKRVIRRSFCHQNSGLIKEFLILIGCSPRLPREIYRIPIEACPLYAPHDDDDGGTTARLWRSRNEKENDESDADDVVGSQSSNDASSTASVGCGDHCGVLTKRETRQIFSSLTLSKTVQNLLKDSTVANNDKVFVYISSKPGANLSLRNVEGLEEDDGFEIPNEQLRKRRKMRHLVLRVKCPQNHSNSISLPERREKIPTESPASLKRSRLDANSPANGGVDAENDDECEKNDEDVEDSTWFRVEQYFTRLQY